jgi:hypothetical protein
LRQISKAISLLPTVDCISGAHFFRMTLTAKLIFPLVLAFAVACPCQARLELPVTRKPTIVLTQAEVIGDKAIQQKHQGFFCIGARFAMLGETEQEWELTYANGKGVQKYVVIDGNGKAEVLDYLRPM